MEDIQFLAWEELLALHAEQLELYGGQDGFTDKGVVESAFNRPRWKSMYGNPDCAELAAEYLYGLTTTQGFADGNKRTGLNAALLFLWKNGYVLQTNNTELFAMTMSVSVGKTGVDKLGSWIRTRLAPRR